MTLETQLADVYTDFKGLAKLKALAKGDSSGALREVAQQFEGVFLQMVLKGMRQASLGDGLLDNDQTRFYRDLYDQQLAVHLSRQSTIGLAELIVRQLGNETGAPSEGDQLAVYQAHPLTADKSHQEIAPSPQAGAQQAEKPIRSPDDFVKTLWPHAARAGKALGIDPKLLLAQAALETGWGKAIIQRADGRSSHNLFNIKADPSWQGERAGVEALEYIDGMAVKQRASFRAYESFEESFKDYIRFLNTHPRYAKALEEASDPEAFARSLQEAGYATDPGYARKILSIYQRGDFPSGEWEQT